MRIIQNAFEQGRKEEREGGKEGNKSPGPTSDSAGLQQGLESSTFNKYSAHPLPNLGHFNADELETTAGDRLNEPEEKDCHGQRHDS